MGNWVQLTSGGGYDFDKGEIIGRWDWRRDMAHSLANENRYAGHTLRPWSVAIHSVAVARAIMQMTREKTAAVAGLMHDAHESILGDIPTPVAWALGYERVGEVKQQAQEAIHRRLFLQECYWPATHKGLVVAADVAALHVERQLLMAPGVRPWDYPEPTTEWAQTMYDVVGAILASNEFAGGGRAAFEREFNMMDCELPE